MDCITVIEQHIIFKMVVQASVVQIGGTYGCNFPIAEALLGMAEARSPFKNTYTLRNQPRVVRPGHGIDYLLVRNTGGDDPYVHAPFGRQTQGPVHFVCGDEVWCKKPEGLLGAGDQIEVYIFRSPFLSQRIVGIGLYKTQSAGHAVFHGEKSGIVVLCLFSNVPHLQELCCQALDGLTFHTDARILPLAIGEFPPKIFIRQIESASKGHLSIHHQNLPVVPMVHKQVQNRQRRIEHLAADAQLVHGFGKLEVYITYAADIIVHQPHFHSLLHFSLQNFK